MKYLLCILSLLCLTAMATEYQLPSMGESTLTPWQEKEWGISFFDYVQTHATLVHDPVVEDYMNDLGFRLVAHSPHPEQHFYFFVVSDPMLNAFAGPDGYIGINSGMILFTRTESELAAVMAHEISHVTEHHLERSIDAAGMHALGSIGAMLAAIFIGSPDLAMGTAATGIAANAQANINFTRAEEQEADRVGIHTLAASGFNPNSMAAVFNLMASRLHLQEDSTFEFLSTHPLFPSRISDAENQAHHYPHKKYTSSLSYFLIKARLHAELSNDPRALLTEAHNTYRLTPTPINTYAYTLALAVNHEYKTALPLLHTLAQHDPDTLIYALTLAHILLANGNIAEGLNTLHTLAESYPDNPLLMTEYTTALVETGHPSQAVQLLKETEEENRDNIAFLLLYARALGESGNLVDAYRVRADVYVLRGNTEGAIGQLNTALQEPHISEYDKALITAKILDIKAKKN